MDAPASPDSHRPASTVALVVATLALFLVWSNTWLVFEVLLAPKHGAAPMTWIDLLVARFALVAPICAAYCFGVRRSESIAIVRRHPVRLLLCGLLSTPIYNGVVLFAMGHEVKGPVASLISALAPLYLVAIGAMALHERIRRTQLVGLVLGFAGVALVASAKEGSGAHGWPVALLAVAPLAWAGYTALTRSVARTVSPLLWTYLVLVVGGAPMLFALPFHGGPAMTRLDAGGWALLLYLALLASVFGNAVWSWLLRHLPASTTGFTVFLNPPLTAASKAVLAVAMPAAFTFSIVAREWIGGAMALAGVAVAVLRTRRPSPMTPPAEP
jgi:drug/metabolite transporter (DMT)-like permease